MKIIFLFVLFLFCSTIWAQDTLIWKNGNRKLTKIVSSDSVIRYRTYLNDFSRTFVVRRSEIASIHYHNGTIEPGELTKYEINRHIWIQSQSIHPLLLGYRQNNERLFEADMLDYVSHNTNDQHILSEIRKTRKAKKSQRIVMWSGVGMFGMGLFLASRGTSGGYTNDAGWASVGFIVASPIVESMFIIPLTVRKVHASHVRKLYNLQLLN
jgi:hypothetical protein